MSRFSVEDAKAGEEVFNRDLATVWQSKQPELRRRACLAAQSLVEEEERVERVDRLELALESPPRLSLEGAIADPGKLLLTFEAPAERRGWTVELALRIRRSFWGRRVGATIRGLRIRAALEIDRGSEVDAGLLSSEAEVQLAAIELEVGGLLGVLDRIGLLWPLRALVQDIAVKVAKKMLRDSLEDGLPDPELVEQYRNAGIGTTSPVWDDPPPSPETFLEPARALSRRITDHHMPFDTVLNTLVPGGDPAEAPSGYIQVEDSSIWTGHFLAGEVLRWHTTRDDEALASIDRALTGLERLAHLTDKPGLLSRVAIPIEEADVVNAMEKERRCAGQEERLFTSRDGKYRSIGHITRDQYAGALLGTGLAALLLEGEQSERAERAKRLALEMIDYLVSQNFCPQEAVPDSAGRRDTSVTYLLNPSHKLAILRLAHRLDPGRYQAQWDSFRPIASIQWIFQWLPTLEPHGSYYKFNLEHALALLLLWGVEDVEERRRLGHGLEVLRRPLRHHANAWFNLVELAAFGDDEAHLSRSRADIAHETAHLLAETFSRSRRVERVYLADDPELDRVPLPGFEQGEERELPEGCPNAEWCKPLGSIARQAVTMPERPGADFLWQRSPFALQVVWCVPDEPVMLSPGIDRTLPLYLALALGLGEP